MIEFRLAATKTGCQGFFVTIIKKTYEHSRFSKFLCKAMTSSLVYRPYIPLWKGHFEGFELLLYLHSNFLCNRCCNYIGAAPVLFTSTRFSQVDNYLIWKQWSYFLPISKADFFYYLNYFLNVFIIILNDQLLWVAGELLIFHFPPFNAQYLQPIP